MRRKKLPQKGWNKDRPFGLGGPLNSGHGDLAPAGGIVHAGCAPHCRRRKVRLAPFPPAAKTAPAPLHPKGTSAPTSWAWALLIFPPRGARRGPHIETSKRKPSRGASLAPAGQFTFCAAPGGKEKMFGGSVCASADLLPPAGDGWQSLAAVRDGNARPLGRPLARESWGYPLLLFSLPLASG